LQYRAEDFPLWRVTIDNGLKRLKLKSAY
jgi:hypothetical protein